MRLLPAGLVLFLAALLLSGCSRMQHVVNAQVSGGRVMFTTEGRVSRMLISLRPCLAGLTVLDGAGRRVWSVSRRAQVACHDAWGFPLAYGQVPAAFVADGPAEPLRPGELYVLSGRDQRSSTDYRGGFRLSTDGRLAVAATDAEVEAVFEALAEREVQSGRPG